MQEYYLLGNNDVINDKWVDQVQAAKIIWNPYDLQNQIFLIFLYFCLKRKPPNIFSYFQFFISHGVTQPNKMKQSKATCFSQQKIRKFFIVIQKQKLTLFVFLFFRKISKSFTTILTFMVCLFSRKAVISFTVLFEAFLCFVDNIQPTFL